MPRRRGRAVSDSGSDAGDASSDDDDFYAKDGALALSSDEDDKGPGTDAGPHEPLHTRPVILGSGPAQWRFAPCSVVKAARAASMTMDRRAVGRATSGVPLSPTKFKTLVRYTVHVCDAVVAAAKAGDSVAIQFEGDATSPVPFAWLPVFSAGGRRKAARAGAGAGAGAGASDSDDDDDADDRIVHASGGMATEAAAAATAVWAHAILVRYVANERLTRVPFKLAGEGSTKTKTVAGVRAVFTKTAAAYSRVPSTTRAAGAALASIRCMAKALGGSDAFLPLWQQDGTLQDMNTVIGALRMADRVVCMCLVSIETAAKTALASVTAAATAAAARAADEGKPPPAPKPMPHICALFHTYGATSLVELACVGMLEPRGDGATPTHLDWAVAAMAVSHGLAVTALKLAQKVVRPGMKDLVDSALELVVWCAGMVRTAADAANVRSTGTSCVPMEATLHKLGWMGAHAPSAEFEALTTAVMDATTGGVGKRPDDSRLGSWPDTLRTGKPDAVVQDFLVQTNVGGSALTDAIVEALG